MKVLGDIAGTTYVVDEERDVMFSVTSGGAIDVLVPSPSDFLLVSGAHLSQVLRWRDSDLLAAVERWASGSIESFPKRGKPPTNAGSVSVVGNMISSGERILSASIEPATFDTLVWLESDPTRITSMGDIEAIDAAIWNERPVRWLGG